MAVAYLSVSGPASAAVRLLGLDPSRSTPSWRGSDLASVCRDAAAVAGDDPASLPSPGSPALDLFAEAHARHHQEEVRLFAS